jgi:hypothetical protein
MSLPDRRPSRRSTPASPPRDIGWPQRVLVEAADRVTGDVHDDYCGAGENALFFAGRGHLVPGIDLLEGPIRESRRKAEERGPDALSPTFESPFARMEYVGDGQFNLAYMRHTGKWWEVYRGLTADECLKRIGDEAIFQP